MAEARRQGSTSERLHALALALQDAGIRGQVRIGVHEDHSRPSPRPPLSGPGSDPAPDPGSGDQEPLLQPLLDRGGLVEIRGPVSCGRTALAYQAALAVGEQGGWIGWIDPADALDPRFARRAGVPLQRLLWVRPSELRGALRAAQLVLKAGFALVVLDLVECDHRALGKLGSAVWIRLQRAARRARGTVLVLAAQSPLAGSFATSRLSAQRTSALFEGGLFEGYALRGVWERARSGGGPVEGELRVRHRGGAGRSDRC